LRHSVVVEGHRHQVWPAGMMFQCGSSLARLSGQLTNSAFDQSGQYASSPGDRAYSYTEITISLLVMAATIESIRCA